MDLYKKILFFIVIIIPVILFAQEEGNNPYERNFEAYNYYMNTHYNILFSIPENSKELYKYYVIWKISKNPQKHIGNLHGPFFIAKDKECIFMYPAMFADFSLDYPKSQIMLEIASSLGFYYRPKDVHNKDTILNFSDYVTTMSGLIPKKMFNADSIYIYDIPNADSLYILDEELEKKRQKKYPHCVSLWLLKNDRLSIDVRLLFTEKGYKRKEEYIKMLDGLICYNE